MSLCFRPTPSLATRSLVPPKLGCRLPHEVFPASWPADPGSYELLHKIGNGGTAVVYRAWCTQLQATVAVKKLDLDSSTDLALIIREAALLRSFQHQHVLVLHTSFVVGRELWLVMPFMDLGSVRSIMRRAYPQGLSEALIATIMHSVLRGLAYVHKNGGIHRDIKADNILISSRGEVRLADFGVAADHTRTMSMMLSRVLRSNSTSSIEGSGCSGTSSRQPPAMALAALRAKTFVGTPCWMAPEVMQQLEEGYGNAADIWSLGITLIELATGTPPLARCHPVRVLVDTLNLPAPSLPPHCSGGRRFSKAFRDLVDLCLKKDPSLRPSALDLLSHPFFRAARSPDFLAAVLLPALLAPAAVALAADSCSPKVAAGFHTASPGGRVLSGVLSQSGGRREVHSEPLLARIWSLLGRAGPGGSSTNSPTLLRACVAEAPSQSSQGVGLRAASRWHFSGVAGAAGAAGPLRMRSMAVSKTAAAAGAGAPPSTAGALQAAASGSLARSGLRPSLLPAPEQAR